MTSESSSILKPPQDATSVTSTSKNPRDLESNRMIEASWNQAEEQLRQQQVREQMAGEIHEQQHPSRRIIHKMIVVLSIVTCIAAVLMLLGQIVGLFIFRSYGPIQYVLHFYVFLLCIMVVLVECELTPVGRQSFIFSYWLTRGLSYAFIGVLGLEENDTANWTNPSDVVENFVKIVAWLMIGVGTIYFLLGLCCIQIIYTKERKDFADRCIRAKEWRGRGGSTAAAVHSTAATPLSSSTNIPSDPPEP